MTSRFTADQIRAACAEGSMRSLAGRYQTAAGRTLRGLPISEVMGALRNAGHKRVARLDRFDLRDAGVEVAEGQYVGGVQPTGRYVDVAVIAWTA